MKLKAIEIPFGKSCCDETISILLSASRRNHCFITGAPGSGKSTLLKVIVETIERSYDKSQAVVWTDYFSHNNENCHNDSIFDVHLPEDITPEGRMITLFERLYEEAQRRLQTLSLNGISSYCQADSMPLLIAVIDDFYPLANSDHGSYATEKLWNVLRLSHAVGISLICSSQLPISRVHGMTYAMADLFNVRIVFRTVSDNIFEALGINQADVSREKRTAIENLPSRDPGHFLYYNRYEAESLIEGQVITMTGR